MNFKKKFSIFLLVLLFIMLLGTFSTCYARTTLTDDEAYYIYTQMFYSSGDIYGSQYINFNMSSTPTLKPSMTDSAFLSFKNYFNQNNTVDIDPHKTLFIITREVTSWVYIYYGNFNNGKTSGLPHLALEFQTGNLQNRTTYFQAIDDNKNSINYSIKMFKCYQRDSTTLDNFAITDTTLPKSSYFYFPDNTYNLNNVNQGFSVLAPLSGLVSFSGTNSIYCNTNGQNFNTTDYSPYLYGTSVVVPTPTPIPTPEPTPEPTATPEPAQVIISKMDDINNNITTQGQNIVNAISGEGLAIRETISGEAQKLHNDLTSYDLDEQSDNVNNLISSMQSSVSGEMSNNEIFRMLDSAEQGFFGLITGEADDFIISWDDVIYENSVIIPAGSINFHQLCRDNQALGQVKFYLNIILSALLGFALLKYLYNLFLATLGIDNQYVYEKNIDSGNISPKVTDSTKHGGYSYDKNGNINGWGRM